MLTTKSISTICYNSIEYLSKVLNQLYEQQVISFYSWVYHYAEEDEKKNHVHLFIFPNGRIDTDSLRGKFLEFELNEDGSRVLDKDGNEKGGILPLPFVSSKFSDWYLYSSHNERYLTSKGESKKYFYSDSEFYNSDDLMFTEFKHQIDWSKLNGLTRFQEMIRSGKTFKEILDTGLVPIQLIAQYEKYYYRCTNIENIDDAISYYRDRGDMQRVKSLRLTKAEMLGLASGGASEGGLIPPESTEQG